MTLQVYKSYVSAPLRKNKRRVISYNDCPKDKHGWVDSNVFIPRDFDLLWIKSDLSSREKTGWWDGKGFYIPKDKKKVPTAWWKIKCLFHEE